MPINNQGNLPGVPPIQNTAAPPADAAPTASRNNARQALFMRADRDTCRAEWRAWARVGDQATGEERGVAEPLMTTCPSSADRLMPSRQIANLGLPRLPERSPADLRVPNVSDKLLTSLPANLPTELSDLDICDNTLSSPRRNLPTGLQILDISSNALSSLPESLPEGLQRIHIRAIQLTRLPTHLPASLRGLGLGSNQLTTLPESIFALPRDCDVYISDNPLTDTARNQLLALNARDDYQSPQMHFSMPQGTQLPERPLQDAVAAWPLPPGADAEQRVLQWQDFANEPGAAAFARLLDRLAETVNATDAQFCQSIGEWLFQAGLENDPDADHIAGPQVRAEIKREIQGQLTQDFLGRHGLQTHPPVR